MERAHKFFAIFFGFEPTISMEDARLKMFLKSKKTIKDPKSPSYFNQPHAACATIPPSGHAMEIS